MNAPGDFTARLAVGRRCEQSGDVRGAIAAFESACRLQPRNAQALRALAGALRRGQRVKEALAVADAAAQFDPDSAATYLCLGDALLANDAAVAADRMYCRALAIDPQQPLAECGRGAVQLLGAEWLQARAAFERALVIAPDCAEARYNIALIDIRYGGYRAGFAAYPAIVLTAEQRPRYHYFYAGVPLWDGTPLGRRRLAVTYEQGIGIQIMVSRFLTELPRFGAAISVETPPTMLALMKRNVPQLTWVEFTHWQPVDAMDVHLPLMQLPTALGVVSESDIAKHVPYLSADPARLDRLRGRLQLEPGVRHVGIVWHGNRNNARERWRAAPLPFWQPLGKVPGVRFHSLQFATTAEELAVAPFSIAPAHELITDMEDTAALACLMDLVISVDTSVVHLAGALGRPVWMPDTLLSDYRWGTGRSHSPWYPTLRIFRQTERDAWQPVFEEIATALAQ